LHDVIVHLIQDYGYAILFLLVAIESLGIPLPGETALVTAAAFAATGDLAVQWVFATGIAAAVIGDNTGYWIGRKGGLPVVERYGHLVGLSNAKLTKVRTFYELHGPKTVLIGRFIAVFRSWAAVLAGVMKMPYARFVAFNAIGCVAWTTVYTTLGYVFGRNLPLLQHYTKRIGFGVAIVVVLGIGFYFFRKRKRTGR
jgi:membrane protein DedA with SNARE-associated domain